MSNNVTIYTFSTCPYCIRAKRLMNNKGVKYEEIEISNNKEKLEELKQKTNSTTVPQIFINDKFIGGCDDIVELHKKGEFDKVFGIK
ncbi:glutaredoxin 3 [Senegalia massiliensis]|uniref:Glutaredoxin n=1 Tax=Senegalia massiliensis TaxID=1720316 RepID=A0A845QZR5_9CLOT|nr:glutaredoxin 3 [Senegalia massiliensis]NBI05853.1 glutaredoxin 3 [Senegalia massiliensis]